MAKRSTQIEVTKIMNNGDVTVTVSKNKMNKEMCEEVIARLVKDCETLGVSDIKEVTFKCVG